MEAAPNKLDTSHHDRRLTRRLAEGLEFRAEFERQQRVIAGIDEIVNRLDALRVEHSLSKAEVARAIDKNPASVRRLLTAKGNPELGTVIAMADALDADVIVVPRKRSRRQVAGLKARLIERAGDASPVSDEDLADEIVARRSG